MRRMYLLYAVSILLIFSAAFISCAWMNERRGNHTSWEGFAQVFGLLSFAALVAVMILAAPYLLLLTATWVIIGILLLVYGLLRCVV